MTMAYIGLQLSQSQPFHPVVPFTQEVVPSAHVQEVFFRAIAAENWGLGVCPSHHGISGWPHESPK